MINVIFDDENYNAEQFFKPKEQQYLKIIQWGRKYPTRFVEKILEVQLTDHQKLIFLNMWTASNVCIAASRSSGKSFLMAIYIMAKCLLWPSLQVAINVIVALIGNFQDKIGNRIAGNPLESHQLQHIDEIS